MSRPVMTREERVQIAAAWRWARTEGWYAAHDGYRSKGGDRVELHFWHYKSAVGISIYPTPRFTREFDVRTAAEALHILAAVGVLPWHLTPVGTEIEKLRRDLATMTEVARSNKRHVKAMAEEVERLSAELPSNGRENPETGEPLPTGVEGHPVRQWAKAGETE